MKAWDRRSLLALGLGAAALALPRVGRAAGAERRIGLVNLHTGERVTATYWADGALVPEALARIDRLMRDHRNDRVTAIDPHLIDDLYRLREAVGGSGSFELISGFRSAETNAALAARVEGVAENSFHVRGQAADVRLPGVDLLRLRAAARSLNAGGVGYYPFSDFLHLDRGPVRFW